MIYYIITLSHHLFYTTVVVAQTRTIIFVQILSTMSATANLFYIFVGEWQSSSE